MKNDATVGPLQAGAQTQGIVRVLHISPASAKSKRLRFHGSTKSVRSVNEYLNSRPIKLVVVHLVRKQDQMLARLKVVHDKKNLKKFAFVIFDIPGSYPQVIKYLRRAAPKAKLIIRAHNAEFFHRIDWMFAEKKWIRKLIRLKSAISGLFKDIIISRVADHVFAVTDWDANRYWKMLGHPRKIASVPYFMPTEYLGSRPKDREKTKTCVCFTSIEPSPLMEEATRNFMTLVEGLDDRDGDWEFIITGNPGRINLCHARIRATGVLNSPFEVLDRALAVAVLSDYGRGIKTKILEAIHAKSYVLVTPGLYKRLPGELKPFCFIVLKGSVESFSAALKRCLEPYPKHNPNDFLRKKFFDEFDRVFFKQPYRQKHFGNSPAKASLMNAEICIGLPIHNGGRYLEESLNCLLGQSFPDFRIVALNDGSTDNSDAIMREYAARDSRIHYLAQEKRSGVVGAWRKVAELAAELYAPKYFAWYSDHDLVDANWLEELYKTHRNNPGTVCAYARTSRITDTGYFIDEPFEPSFDSSKMQVWQRIEQAVLFAGGYGDIVYGLLQMEALNSCDIFRDELFPDRILVSELSIYGDIRRVATVSRSRRITAHVKDYDSVVERQLRILFPDDFSKNMPYISHATCLLRTAVTPPPKESEEYRFRRIYLAWLYFIRIMGKFRQEVMDELKKGALLDPEIRYLQKFLIQTKGKTIKLHERYVQFGASHQHLHDRYRWTKIFGIFGLLAYKLIKARERSEAGATPGTGVDGHPNVDVR